MVALPLAEVRQETARLEPPRRNPAARKAGWFPATENGVRWSRGDTSRLDLFLVAPRALTLAFRAEPAPFAGRPRQRVAVAVNGSPAGEVALEAGTHDYRLAIPAALLQAGDNELRFGYQWVGPTTGAAAEPRRPIAVGWHQLSLSPVPPPRSPRRAGNTLELPPGTRLDWYFHASGALVLELPAVSGPPGSRLLVHAQAAGGGEELLAELRPGGRKQWLDLPSGQEQVLRLSLTATASEDPTTAPLRVDRPRVLGRLAARSGTRAGRPPSTRGDPRRGPPPSILLYLVDTLRADRLGAYGARRRLTPQLDRLAAESTVFTTAVAQSPWTRPSVATLFTGLGPLRHGVTRLDSRLPDHLPTLAELLARAGYRSAALSTNAHVTAASGLARGFDELEYRPQASAAEVGRWATGWLDRHRDERPFLLYLHTLEPHAPYTPPPALRARFAPGATPGAGSLAWLRRLGRLRGDERRRALVTLGDLYDGEVAALDRAFGALRAELDRRGRWDSLLVVVVADHGESLGERGVVGHARNLHQEALAVPLLVKLPGQHAGRRSTARAQHLDLLPTLLAAAGVAPPPGLVGIDLLAGAPAGPRPAIAHLDYKQRAGFAVYWGRWKWIEPLSAALGDGPALYDLAADPQETRDLAALQPVLAGWMRTLLRAERLQATGRSERAVLDAATRAELEALGYL